MLSYASQSVLSLAVSASLVGQGTEEARTHKSVRREAHVPAFPFVLFSWFVFCFCGPLMWFLLLVLVLNFLFRTISYSQIIHIAFCFAFVCPVFGSWMKFWMNYSHFQFNYGSLLYVCAVLVATSKLLREVCQSKSKKYSRFIESS